MQHACFKVTFHMFQFNFTLAFDVIMNAFDANAHALGC
jgi:hypothetical protein